ncbi:MAG: hypothetical protein ACYS1A_07595 [Planctomycetota bacterium]|jgi:membrane-bound ClpP family serine protease
MVLQKILSKLRQWAGRNYISVATNSPTQKICNSQSLFSVIALLIFLFASPGFADTFVNRRTSETLHGYATSKNIGGKTVVQTLEKGKVQLQLAQWKVTADRSGRNDQVIIITLDKEIILDIETTALEKAFKEAADKGPVAILFEIDTPGGRIDYAMRICSAVTDTKNCEVIAFIKGGEFGGAISAGAALAFACDQIYMADNSIIGSASLVYVPKKGAPDLKEADSKLIREKMDSAWKASLASLAQQNQRPGLLARAMIDKDIEVIEVANGNQKSFIDPANKRPNQKIVHTWSKKGSLLTLTAKEALKCGIVDKVITSREDLLNDKGIADFEIIIDDHLSKAEKEFRRARRKYDKLRKSIDFQAKQLQQTRQLQKALKIFRGIRADFKALIKLAKRYPDFEMSVEALQAELNSIEAVYTNLKIDARRRK